MGAAAAPQSHATERDGDSMMTETESNSWKPNLPGWSTDIIQFYDHIADQIPNFGIAVELGVWCGRSLTFLAHKLRNVQHKRCTVVGVDAWPNGYGFGGHDERMAAAGGVFVSSLMDMFREAPELARDLWIHRCESSHAARLFDDGQVDFVFVDAAHDYEHVRADILAWLPKVKRGGIIAGHDYTSDYPGVERAVEEAFGPRGGGVVQNPVGVVWMVRR